MSKPPAIPELVRRAFSLPADEPLRLGRAWNNGWKVGSYVLSPVADGQYSTRTASVRACLQVPGVHIARPIRASDGRYVFSGWQATQYLPGTLTRRADEHVAVALRLEKALQDIPVSTVFPSRSKKQSRRQVSLAAPDLSLKSSSANCLMDLFSCADSLAWSENTSFLDDAPAQRASGNTVLEGMSALRGSGESSDDVAAEPAYELATQFIAAADSLHADLGENYLCHGDLVHSVVCEGAGQPAVTDFFPLRRPAGYSAALAIVDNLIAENAGLGLLRRYLHIPCIELLCLRAGAYRLLIHSGLQQQGLAQSSNIVSNLQKLL